MNSCYEAGQIIVQPKIGGWESLSKLLREAELGNPDLLYSTEDVLRHYGLLGQDRETPHPLPEGFTSYPVLIRVPLGQELDFAQRYRGLPSIAVAVPNYYTRPTLSGLRYNEETICEITRATGLDVQSSECGSNVKVAILDTGVDGTIYTRNPAKQYDSDAPRELNTGLTPYDPVGHGTVVASLVSRGAPGANILPIKVMEERGNLMGAISGLFIAIAVNAPEIINMSLSLTCDTGHCQVCGYSSSDAPVTFEQIKLLFGQVDQIYLANNRPLPLLVAAAGNVRPGDPLTIPACFENFLAVGACEGTPNYGIPTEYSRYAKVPEERFVRAVGGLDHPERCIATLSPQQGAEIKQWGNKRFFGTSFAAPVVTAIAARYLCATKDRTPCSLGMISQAGRAFIQAGRAFMMRCIKEGAYRGMREYNPNIHGLGLAVYSRDIASLVAKTL